MGLPIAKAIVTAHGGSISVTSQLGTRFGFFLHAADQSCQGAKDDEFGEYSCR